MNAQQQQASADGPPELPNYDAIVLSPEMLEEFKLIISEQWPQDGQETIGKDQACQMLKELSDKDVSD